MVTHFQAEKKINHSNPEKKAIVEKKFNMMRI